MEYAIGDWIVIRAVGWGSLSAARALLGVVAFGADLVAWRAVWRGWSREAALRYLWLGTPLLAQQWAAVAMVFSGLLCSTVVKSRKRTQKQE